MEAKAHLKKVRLSPRKARLVVNMVRGLLVDKALQKLYYQPQKAAKPVARLLQSVKHNWLQHHAREEQASSPDLLIKTIYVNGAGMLKRIKPAAQQRAHRIRKRFASITVVVEKDTTK